MASETEIANLALSHLGIGKQIGVLSTERSEEANACRQFYETARDATLRDFPWPFATRIIALGLVEEDPNDEWGFSYRYPSNGLKIIRILSGIRNETNDARVPYKITQDDDGLLLLSDQSDAQIEYIVRADDPTLYPSDFKLALSFRLAMYIAPRITSGDDFKIQSKLAQFYNYEISKAMATSVNEMQPDVQPESEFIRTRDGINSETERGFLIPN